MVNAGSASIKLSLVDVGGGCRTVVSIAEGAAAEPAAVGHRLVHGGPRLLRPTAVDDALVREVEALREIAPLHNEAGLAAMAEARERLPDLPHVAVFDTAFHATLPDDARVYALPARWEHEHGLRRYGFHGISVAWSSERAAELLGRAPGGLGLVVLHLGGGCSATAVAGGRSADTTMGMTPLEGMPMATRSGSVDPGALLHLLRRGLGVEELDRALNHESGLLGISDSSGDLRELERRRASDPRADLALRHYARRIAGAAAAMASALDRLDALVFTGGAGEGSAGVREAVCARLAPLGVALDRVRNRLPPERGDLDLAAPGAPVRVLRIHAREDLVIARETRALLSHPR